ncbi:hypothetical protein QEZ54_17885 [Catellatospora sp. KI3]|uniref:hypothetical protein n=1 Tax=Catellatospora sp. KI3 TaxID=3041620 RepID=UPI0024825EAC|nr:hypothetical protein [Catellatospora sp. KI3]MDI1462850.1 hypothetical protein [Catellatospora sp. KI3]
MQFIGLVGLYALLVALLGAALVLAVLVGRAQRQATAAESAGLCASTAQRDCRVVEETAVSRRTAAPGGEGDADSYAIATEAHPQQIAVDHDVYQAVHVGDQVRLTSYNGKITHVLIGGRDWATGAYTDAVIGRTTVLWVAVALLTSVCCATASRHRTGRFQGFALLLSVVAAALMFLLSVPLRTALASVLGAAPAAYVGAALIAAAWAVGWIRITRRHHL